MPNAVHTVVIPAAGLGTRLLPATKSVPKELLPVYDRPAIQFALDEAVAAGARRVVIVTSPGKGLLTDYLRPDDHLAALLRTNGKSTLFRELVSTGVAEGVDLQFVLQARPLGLGHAVLCARDAVGEGAFGVILPDDVIFGPPCLKEMVESYREGHMIAAQTVPLAEVNKYGIFRPDLAHTAFPGQRSIRVNGMVEKPLASDAPSRLAAVGRYILNPSIFSKLAALQPSAGGEFQLTDAIELDAQRTSLRAFLFSGTRFDCGSHEGLFAASQARRQSLVEQSRPLPVLAASRSASAL